MPQSPLLRHILVDFENVPKTTLAPLARLHADVTLIIGRKNKQPDVGLFAETFATGLRLHFVRVDGSGHNALDITLAYYLGRAVAENPRAEFFIVSKDTDYDVMIKHAQQYGVVVSRHGSVEDLPFVKDQTITATITEARLRTYAQKLRNGPAPRDLGALKKKILNDLKKHIRPEQIDEVINWLKEHRVFTIEATEKVKIHPNT